MYKRFVDNLSYTITGHALPRDDLNPSYAQRLKRMLSLYLSQSLKVKLKKFATNIKITHKKEEFISHPMAVWGALCKIRRRIFMFKTQLQ